METALRALLVAGLPGMSAGRLNWGEHPRDETRPYVTLHLISLREGRTMQGPDGLEQSRVQVDCYAPTFGQAREIGQAVKQLLNHYRGGGFRGVFFDGMRTLREGGDSRIIGSDESAAFYRASLDFLINWRNDNG